MTAAGYLHHLAHLADLAHRRRALAFRRPTRRRTTKSVTTRSPLPVAPSP